MAKLIITIDGPAASGKSTVARALARKLGATFLDTGAMYRALTLAAMQAGINLSDEQKLLDVLDNTEFRFASDNNKMTVFINTVDVTDQIRSAHVTDNARYIASAPELRTRLVQMQRQFAANAEKIVTEGRDQGTVAFFDANIKFFLTAALAERAKRRQTELADQGTSPSLRQIQQAIKKRDASDENRTVGPLKPADDAFVVDTTNLTVEQVVEKLLRWTEKQCSKTK